MRILVVGATGYVGGRIVPRLLEAGHTVRVLVRNAQRFRGRPGSERVEIVEGDVRVYEDCLEATSNCDIAYYLVHSLGSGSNYGVNDRIGAQNFSTAGRHLKHIIYLGGIQPADSTNASGHLASRAEVGKLLGRLQNLTEFRAGPIIGSGSASFEMIRYLTERLPFMVAPKWVNNHVQPIAIRDVLSYLIKVIELEPQGVVDIGMESISFADMMRQYATERGLKRRILSVPVLAPNIAARWVSWVTPISKQLAVPIVEGIAYPLVGDNKRSRELFSDIKPINYQTAVHYALDKIRLGNVESHWSGSLSADFEGREVVDEEGMFREIIVKMTDASSGSIYQVISQIGGDNGWMTWSWAWKLRGMIDKLVGGPGIKRGRRNAKELLPGEAVDFWRVEIAEENKRLRLRAEMKMPGRAWLEWEIEPHEKGNKLIQRAFFIPDGLLGFLYWYAAYPFHLFIFPGLVKAILKKAKKEAI